MVLYMPSCNQDYFFMQLRYTLNYLTTNIDIKGSVPLMFKKCMLKTRNVYCLIREAPARSPALFHFHFHYYER